MGHGYLTQKSAFKKLKAFEEDEICLYTSNVAQNKMPKIKAKTLRRDPYKTLTSNQMSLVSVALTFNSMMLMIIMDWVTILVAISMLFRLLRTRKKNASLPHPKSILTKIVPKDLCALSKKKAL